MEAGDVPEQHTFDARTYTNIGYPFTDPYPVSLGDKDKGGVPTGLCIVGGKTVASSRRTDMEADA